MSAVDHGAFTLPAAVGASGVMLAAFGAHGLKKVGIAEDLLGTWEVAGRHHLLHAVVLLVLATLGPAFRRSRALIAAGVLVFSGSLYVLVLSGVRALGAVTPLGGLLLIAGWTCVALDARAARGSDSGR